MLSCNVVVQSQLSMAAERVNIVPNIVVACLVAVAGWPVFIEGYQLAFSIQVQLQTTEPPSFTHTESLPGRDILQRSPMDLGDVDLATQCVDSTLLSAGDDDKLQVQDLIISENNAQVPQQVPNILHNCMTHGSLWADDGICLDAFRDMLS